MSFVDILTTQLFVLGFAGLILVYVTIQSYFLWKRDKNIRQGIKSAQIPLGMLGIYATITGIYGLLTWPLPGAYNTLFYDIYPLFGLMLVSLAWALHSDLKAQYAGVLSFLIGVMAIFYGITGYNLGLTTVPIALLGLYGMFGLSGVLAYPVTVMIDRAQDKMKNRSKVWILMIGLFMVCMLIASLLAIYIALSAVPAHLAAGM